MLVPTQGKSYLGNLMLHVRIQKSSVDIFVHEIKPKICFIVFLSFLYFLQEVQSQEALVPWQLEEQQEQHPIFESFGVE